MRRRWRDERARPIGHRRRRTTGRTVRRHRRSRTVSRWCSSPPRTTSFASGPRSTASRPSAPGPRSLTGLDSHPADVLLSIANLRLIPDDVLDRVATAINFHDGPLPALRRAQRHLVGPAGRRARARDHVAPDDVRRRRRRHRRHRVVRGRRRRDRVLAQCPVLRGGPGDLPPGGRGACIRDRPDDTADRRPAARVPAPRPAGPGSSIRPVRPPIRCGRSGRSISVTACATASARCVGSSATPARNRCWSSTRRPLPPTRPASRPAPWSPPTKQASASRRPTATCW